MELVVDETVLSERALDYLDTLMADYVMGAGTAVKTADVAREVGDRLGASARLVRNEPGFLDSISESERPVARIISTPGHASLIQWLASSPFILPRFKFWENERLAIADCRDSEGKNY